MTDLSCKNKGFIKSLLIKEPDTNLRTIYKLVKSLNTKEISNESIKQYVTKIRVKQKGGDNGKNPQTPSNNYLCAEIYHYIIDNYTVSPSTQIIPKSYKKRTDYKKDYYSISNKNTEQLNYGIYSPNLITDLITDTGKEFKKEFIDD